MINQLHACFHCPKKGWDPIDIDYANAYAKKQWSTDVDINLMEHLEKWTGGLAGKRILDLGGGGGQYSIAFAKRGAQVTWYDVSRNYANFAIAKSQEHSVNIRFVMGYMDHAYGILQEQFDLVFNRVCWYYGFSDSGFAKTVYALTKPGGIGYISTQHASAAIYQKGPSIWLRTWLNKFFSIKIGHPYPPHNRLLQLFSQRPCEMILADYSDINHDRITFLKSK
ncbi:MAG: hypothetical protein K0R24_848 [Gammaproteobacteria bacterium]|jgi:2-polyprenyl-3-methyl-5-hydroxy-6-metoxy-1,4-benzoquinol methylase|nr:hypothetical protein [Gammaproteobacteria bacterium]